MFVPRSLLRVDVPEVPRRVKARTSKAPVANSQALTSSYPLTAPAAGVAEDAEVSIVASVRKRSYEQRNPTVSEPTCSVCGRYGEYVCDATDEDICSLECKAVALHRAGFPPEDVAEALIALEEKKPEESSSANVQLPEQKVGVGQENVTDRQAYSLRTELQISVKGDDVPKLILDFKGCDFPATLVHNLKDAGYDLPTPIQMQAIPVISNGRHLLASAPTGSGKTAAFLIPVLAHISRLQSTAWVQDCFPRVNSNPDGVQERPGGVLKHPLALILGPTRELCTQIEQVAQVLARGLPGIKTALIVGGNSLSQQMHRLEQGCQVIIATPGRLIDVLVRTEMALDKVQVAVMDEVDAMLELGFRDQVMQIVSALQQPQMLLFSATIPPETERFSRKLLTRPVYVAVGQRGVAATSVRQTVIWVEEKDKKRKLFDVLAAPRHFSPPAVVFVASKQGADLLSQAVVHTTGVSATSLHADKSPGDRKGALEKFRAGEICVLVATSMMGRGLDLPKVNQVIIFDFPPSVEEYLHQVGRVGRLGKGGRAMVFVNRGVGARVLGQLAGMWRETGTCVPKEVLNITGGGGGFSGGRDWRREGEG